jgi:hypothetical protein
VVEVTSRAENYGYDFDYRLLSQAVSGASITGVLNYTVDPVGNHLAPASYVAPVPAQSFTFDF